MKGLAKKEAELIELVLSSKLMLDQANSADWEAAARTESIRRQELELYFKDQVPASCREAVRLAIKDILALNRHIERLISEAQAQLGCELADAVHKAKAANAYSAKITGGRLD